MKNILMEIYTFDSAKLADLVQFYGAHCSIEPTTQNMSNAKIRINENDIEDFLDDVKVIGFKYHKERVA